MEETESPHDFCNWLWLYENPTACIKTGIIVGSYPRGLITTPKIIKEGVRVVINLCTTDEKKRNRCYRNLFPDDTLFYDYPITRGSVPDVEHLHSWAVRLIGDTFDRKPIYYVHSLSGHGRSHMVGLLLFSLITGTTDWLILQGRAHLMYTKRKFCYKHKDGPWRPPFDNDAQVEMLKKIRPIRERIRGSNKSVQYVNSIFP